MGKNRFEMRRRRRPRKALPGAMQPLPRSQPKTPGPAVDAVLTAKADAFLRRLGRTAPMVPVLRTQNGLASAAGVTLFNVSLGQIRVSERLVAALDAECIDFVLAHEVAHIWRNHIVATAAFSILRAKLDHDARKDRDLRALLTAYDVAKILMFKGGALPMDAEITKAQELEADALAVRLIGNVDAAHRTLVALAGGDRSAPSHTWEVFNTAAPVMTIGERLDALDATFGIIRWPAFEP